MPSSDALIWKILKKLVLVIFLAMSVVQYLAYFQGLFILLPDYIPRLLVILALCLTYVFRLDFVAAALGFYGAWQGWHMPEWQAILGSVGFLLTSISLNRGRGSKIGEFMWRHLPLVKAEETIKDKNEVEIIAENDSHK